MKAKPIGWKKESTRHRKAYYKGKKKTLTKKRLATLKREFIEHEMVNELDDIDCSLSNIFYRADRQREIEKEVGVKTADKWHKEAYKRMKGKHYASGAKYE